MNYQILKLVLTWCINNIQKENAQLQKGIMTETNADYIQAQADLAFALKEVMKYN
jgi:hypothetical protein